jgi:hypothetical protein
MNWLADNASASGWAGRLLTMALVAYFQRRPGIRGDGRRVVTVPVVAERAGNTAQRRATLCEIAARSGRNDVAGTRRSSPRPARSHDEIRQIPLVKIEIANVRARRVKSPRRDARQPQFNATAHCGDRRKQA